MTKWHRSLLSASLVLASVGGVSLTPPAMAQKLLEGQVCEANVHKLTSEIDWNKDLSKAEELAQQQNKLILWIHMVGKIDGAT